MMSARRGLVKVYLYVCMREGECIVPENLDAPAEIAVIFQVLYDTPQGTIRLTVQDYTPAAAEQGVRCQIGHRKVSNSRSAGWFILPPSTMTPTRWT